MARTAADMRANRWVHRSGRRTARLAMVLGLAATAACATLREPLLPALREAPKTPVIVVPGITGTVLRDGSTGEVLWGSARSIAFPPDRGYRLALPLDATDDGVVVDGPVMDVRFGLWRREVYGTVARLLEQNGYRRGDLERPGAHDTFFFFGYDWRASNVESARRLARRLDHLADARGPVEVDLVCQSNAAHICRWLTKFGNVALEDAEEGVRRHPRGASIRKVILVGTANGGAIRVLREMNRGRRYLPPIGRHWPPEVFFTFRSVYEDLPAYQREPFVNLAGEPLEIDLFAAETWRRFGWSIFAPSAASRTADDTATFGTEAERLDWLRGRLDEAARFQRLLASDVDVDATYYSLQNANATTPERAVIVRGEHGTETLFTGDRRVERDERLRTLASAPGDGHATIDSQRWLSPAERAAFNAPPSYFDGGHFEMITRPALQRRLLEILFEERSSIRR